MPAAHPPDGDRHTHHAVIVQRFEAAWQRGQRPALADYLPADGPERRPALVELIHVDLGWRLKVGDWVRVEAYLEYYPELADDPCIVIELLAAEWRQRRRHEPHLRVDGYRRRFPQLGEALQARLHDHADSGDAAEPATLPPRPSVDSEAPTVPPAPAPVVEDPCPTPAPPEPVEAAAAGAGAWLPSVPGYEIVSELGRGGMGAVYQARQTQLNRLVALKMILAGAHAGEQELARFRTEAEAVARLQHPNIVQIHEVGEWRAGDVSPPMPFFSLEYCAGGSLADKLDGTPLPPEDAARLVETLARAMDAAHRAGIIHRDLKPANVLLASGGREPPEETMSSGGSRPPLAEYTPKITDFGLAKKLDSGSGQTASGAILGTPSYMAPEQAGGQNKAVGPLADVYALGAILYELLTGRPPFKAATAMDTLLLVVSEEPVPPRQLQPKLPRDLETICLKCLQKEAKKRYARAADLAEDLRRFGTGEPIQARPVGRWERGVKWARRRPAVAALLAALVLAALGMAAGGAWFTLSLQRALGVAEDERDKANEARQQAEDERHRADAARTRAEWLAYAGQIALAQREWEDGNVGHARDLLAACQWNLRGWEHHYLSTLFNQNQRTFRGHTGPVFSVAISPDGKRLLSGSGGHDQQRRPLPGEVKLWDAQTGRETLNLKGHTGPVNSVAFSPDGIRLASGGGLPHKPGEVKVWDAQTGQEILSLKGHTGGVTSVAFSPDGKRLVSGSRNLFTPDNPGEIKVWDAQTGQETLALQGRTDGVYSVAFSPDGKRLVSGGDDNKLKVWDAQTGQLIRTLQRHSGTVFSVAFSPDGKRLASASADKTIKVSDAQTGQEIRSLKGHTETVASVAFSPGAQRLVSSSWDGTIKVWNAQTGQLTLSLKGHSGPVWSVAFSLDGKRLVSGSWDKTVKMWDAQTGQETLTFQGNTDPVGGTAFSPDGQRLVSASGNAPLKVRDAQTGQEILAPKGQRGFVPSVAFSPDGQRLAGGGVTTFQLWDAQTGQETLTVKGHTSMVNSVAFSPDGKRLATASDDKTVKVWDVQTGQEILTLKGHANGVSSVAFSPDGQRLASASFDRTVKVWDVATGQPTLTLNGHMGEVWSVAFSPDGQRLASGSWDQTVKVWDAQTGQLTLTLNGHTGQVWSVAFSPDGKRLASASGDRTVKLWDAATGQEALSLKGHTDWVRSVAFSPDGKRLVSGSQNGTVIVWDASRAFDEAPEVVVGPER
jgi:WD40 repeat protein